MGDIDFFPCYRYWPILSWAINSLWLSSMAREREVTTLKPEEGESVFAYFSLACQIINMYVFDVSGHQWEFSPCRVDELAFGEMKHIVVLLGDDKTILQDGTKGIVLNDSQFTTEIAHSFDHLIFSYVFTVFSCWARVWHFCPFHRAD